MIFLKILQQWRQNPWPMTSIHIRTLHYYAFGLSILFLSLLFYCWSSLWMFYTKRSRQVINLRGFLGSNLLFKKVFASKAYYISNLLLKNYLYAPKRISGKAQGKKLWYTYLQLNVADINLNVIKWNCIV